jgi:hypothetical protein
MVSLRNPQPNQCVITYQVRNIKNCKNLQRKARGEFASKTYAAVTKRAKYDNAALRDTTKMIYPAMLNPKSPLEFR